MNYLVGDIGNTLTKLSILNDNFKIKKIYNIETKKIYKKNSTNKVFNKIIKKKLSKTILFSSVVPKAFRIIKVKLKKHNFKVFEIKDLKIKNILKIEIKNYNHLGSDRISNALGSLKYKNCLIIDFGTATTFDVIKNGVYDGGVISPGIDLSILNLKNSTALLPSFKLRKNQRNYGKNTKEALNAGFLWGYEGLINNIIKKIIKKNGINFKIVLTGGYSHLFRNRLIKRAKIDNDITMQGIIKIYKYFLL